jgi:hypothetical protein
VPFSSEDYERERELRMRLEHAASALGSERRVSGRGGVAEHAGCNGDAAEEGERRGEDERDWVRGERTTFPVGVADIMMQCGDDAGEVEEPVYLDAFREVTPALTGRAVVYVYTARGRDVLYVGSSKGLRQRRKAQVQRRWKELGQLDFLVAKVPPGRETVVERRLIEELGRAGYSLLNRSKGVQSEAHPVS